jgi:hypothetical protein
MQNEVNWLRKERDAAHILLTRIGGAIIDAGDVVVPAEDAGLDEAVRQIVTQRDEARDLAADYQHRAEISSMKAEEFMRDIDDTREQLRLAMTVVEAARMAVHRYTARRPGFVGRSAADIEKALAAFDAAKGGA